jgi:hypothetical protein
MEDLESRRALSRITISPKEESLKSKPSVKWLAPAKYIEF